MNIFFFDFDGTLVDTTNVTKLSALYALKQFGIDEENDTVGIIICKNENKYVIEYCSDDRIIAREYELV